MKLQGTHVLEVQNCAWQREFNKKTNMNHSLVGYSPYRNALRKAKQQENNHKQLTSTTTEVIKFRFSSSMLIVTMFLFILGFGGLYLMNFNKVATKGYILKRTHLYSHKLYR